MAQPDNTVDTEYEWMLRKDYDRFLRETRRPISFWESSRRQTRRDMKALIRSWADTLKRERQLGGFGQGARLARSSSDATQAASRTVESALERNRREYGQTRGRPSLLSVLTRGRLGRMSRKRGRRRRQ